MMTAKMVADYLRRQADVCIEEAGRDLAPRHARGMAAGFRISAEMIERELVREEEAPDASR